MDHEEKGTRKTTIIYHLPSLSTFVFYTTLVIAAIAIIIPLDFHYGSIGLYKYFDASLPHDISIKDYILLKAGMKEIKLKEKVYGKKESVKIFTKEELKKYSGESDIRYLAIIGQVFDVTKGTAHYSKTGGYNFFTGIDGSRAYVTGKFDIEGLTDNIEGLSPQDYIALDEWLQFYHKDYTYLGNVVGYFYDENGNERPGISVFREGIENGKKEKKRDGEENLKFPECNSSWKPETGAVVWCSKHSGGVERNWVGFPRKLFKVGKNDYRCACVREELLNDPRLKAYDGCDGRSTQCKIPDV